MPATMSPQASQEINDRDFQRRVNALRQADNFTNFFYIAREWALIALFVGVPILFFQSRDEWVISWLWNVPVALLAIILVGACQHRISNIAHEASHYMLFKNRILNELAGDWFAMFPLLSSTHHYRLQHLAHHQFVNDPERDPDISQMTESGHRYDFPMSRGRFVWECVIKQLLWVPNLIRYIRVRAKYNSTGGGTGPYEAKGKRSPILVLVGMGYILSLIGALTALVMHGDPVLLAIVPPVMLAAIMTVYALIPSRMYRQTLVRPNVSLKVMTLLRFTHMTIVFTTLAWLTLLTGHWWAIYYIALWTVPQATMFSFCMILRQVVQHGNGSQERLTNTRIFHVNRLIQLAVFPWGMDYHLPHHMFPMVPHFRLRQLHDLLMETEEYRKHATVVDGYFFHSEHPPTHPTVLDLMASPRN
jgi:fatty acid desaturase